MSGSMPGICRAAIAAVATLAAAISSAAPAEELPAPAAISVHSLRPGLHLVEGVGCNVVVWSGPDGTLLVDSGASGQVAGLTAEIETLAPGPARIVINSHWHPDHTGGNAALAASGGLLIAQDRVRARMSAGQVITAYDLEVAAAPRVALPIVTFDDTLTLHLNGDRLTAVHVESAHTDGDLVLWWQAANVVHVGDLFYAGRYPFIDLDSGGSLAGVVAALELVLSRADARTVVIPGHGAAAGRADLVEYRDMLVAVGRRVRALIDEGRSRDEVLAARPSQDFDARFGQGPMAATRFVGILYDDLAARR